MERGSHGRARGRGQRMQETRAGGPAPSRGPQQPAGAWGGGPPRQPHAPQQSYQPAPQQAYQAAPPPQQAAWGQPRQQPPQQQPRPQPSVGRVEQRGGAVSVPGSHAGTSGGNGNGNGNGDGAHSGRGAHRGKRQLHEVVIRTKPDNLATKKGDSGSAIRLHANYFELLHKPDWCLFQYRVDFAPEIDATRTRKHYFWTAIKEMDLSGYLFDGTVLFTPRRLAQNPMELFVDPEGGGPDKIRITIKLVGDVNPGDYQYIQLYNIIMRRCMNHLKLQLVGRNFFDPGASIQIRQHNMELWPGYVTSIRQHESKVLMCAEVTYKVMRNDTVLHLLNEIAKTDRANTRNTFCQEIIGKIVLTAYNNKTYRIDDVDFSNGPSSTFEKRDGSKISYIDYMQQRYGLRVTNNNQPLLISKAKARELRAGQAETVILIPEFCRLTGLTENQRNNFNLMKSLAEYTRVGPPQRIEKLMSFNNRLYSNPEVMKLLREWDLDLARAIVEIKGRVLATEKLFDGQEKFYSAGQFVDWTRELRARKMFLDVPLSNWAVVTPFKLKQSAVKFVKMLVQAGEGMRWKVNYPRLHEIPDDRIGTYLSTLDGVVEENPQLIMVVVFSNKNDKYSAIKKKCCVDKAIPSQVIVAKNMEKGLSVATKVAIQMNCKIGGAPWTVSIPPKNIMVVGYDVCHDPTDKRKSYGAMVASLDQQITRYYSNATAHTSGEELSNDFALNIIKGCRAFQEQNGFLPAKILIYRDGVGDGQIQYVYEHEVELIKKRLQEFYKEQPVKMAFIIVSKRINTRVFANKENPPPGTVVDDVITLPERYDFFIVSQCTRQGTVSPTSYNVIFDTFELPADKLQILTYKLCHMYFNWSGTVRVPAPCQYAHKLAFLVAQSLHRSPNPGLNKLLYFL